MPYIFTIASKQDREAEKKDQQRQERYQGGGGRTGGGGQRNQQGAAAGGRQANGTGPIELHQFCFVIQQVTLTYNKKISHSYVSPHL